MIFAHKRTKWDLACVLHILSQLMTISQSLIFCTFFKWNYFHTEKKNMIDEIERWKMVILMSAENSNVFNGNSVYLNSDISTEKEKSSKNTIDLICSTFIPNKWTYICRSFPWCKDNFSNPYVLLSNCNQSEMILHFEHCIVRHNLCLRKIKWRKKKSPS